MQVCTLFEYPTLNGGERSWLAALPELQRCGWSITALAPGTGPLADALAAIGVHHVRWRTITEGGRRTLEPLRAELADHFRRLRPDVIHANSLSCSRCVGPVARELGIPSVGHLRDIVRLSHRAVADINANTRFIAVSRAVRDWHVRQKLDPLRVEVVHNGVNLQEFQPRRVTGMLHEELGLTLEMRLLGAVGQLGMRKGWDVLLDAFAQVVARHRRISLVVVGERNSHKLEAIRYEQALRDRAAREDLRGRVHFLGRRHDVPSLMNEWELLAHAARQEPLGRVLLEAMASGLPVVATDAGGTPEIFSGPAAGAAIVVPTESPLELAGAIDRLLGDAAARHAMGCAGRAAAECRFDAARAGRALADQLRAAVHDPK